MASTHWPTEKWPEGVQHEISGFDKPLYSLLDDSAREYPEHVYTIFNDAERTYSDVWNAANRVAGFLAARGIKKGDRVAIFLPNTPHYPAIFFGILKAGAVCVTCNPMYTPQELNYQLNDSGTRLVFCMDHPTLYPTAVEGVKNSEVETVVICNVKSQLPWLKGFLGGLLGKIPKAESHEPDHLFYDDVIPSADPTPLDIRIDPAKDLALIIYTGGTTGVPKGAALTHSNFVFDVMAVDEWVRVPPRDGAPPERLRRGGGNCFLGVLPWYHSFGLTLCMLSACAGGNRLVCIADPKAGDPPFTEVLKSVEKHRTTLMVAVPTIYVAFTNHPLLEKYNLTSINVCASGGAPLPVEVAKQFEAKTGAIIFEGYGLSETSPVITTNPTNLEGRKFGSVGFPMPNTVVKIVDTETGLKELPQGEDGEIAAAGPQIMAGYWNKPEENDEVFREIDGQRYFLTGDIGHIDDEGYIIITDRKKDLIIVGGFNCYPREVEEVLYTHPKVANAAVVGLPDPKSGEKVKAFIQLVPGQEATEEEIMEFCRDKMAGYKRPRAVEFRDELPTSLVGKVLRRVLRDEEMGKG